MDDPGLKARETSLGFEFQLHVLPRAKRSELAGLHNGALKMRVTAPPVDDAANRAILEFFSSLLDIPKSRIQILTGVKSRDKRIQIKGLNLSRFLEIVSAANGL
jgi:uncharacterized protein